MKVADRSKRSYRQGARAVAAEETAQRIVSAFGELARVQFYDQITLDAVARDAGVTVQTVIRRFGGKGGLLEALMDKTSAEITVRRANSVRNDIASVVGALVDDYEAVGEMVLHLLEQESRWPAVHALCERGRVGHRKWVGIAFSQPLAAVPAAQRRACVDALVIATDVYSWKLLRIDMQRSVGAAKSVLCAIVRGVLRQFTKGGEGP